MFNVLVTNNTLRTFAKKGYKFDDTMGMKELYLKNPDGTELFRIRSYADRIPEGENLLQVFLDRDTEKEDETYYKMDYYTSLVKISCTPAGEPLLSFEAKNEDQSETSVRVHINFNGAIDQTI